MKDTNLSRGELGIRMLCAWNNIPRDKAPASWSEHHNEWTREAWARVAEAAIHHHLETHPPAKALDGIAVTDAMADRALERSKSKDLNTMTNTEAMRQIIISALSVL